MTMLEPGIYSASASVHELAGIRAFVFERLTFCEIPRYDIIFQEFLLWWTRHRAHAQNR
jgi:hypothetical protein